MDKKILELINGFDKECGNIYSLASEILDLQNQLIKKKLEDAGEITADGII